MLERIDHYSPDAVVVYKLSFVFDNRWSVEVETIEVTIARRISPLLDKCLIS